MKRYSDVDAYLADSPRWPDEIAALRPMLLGAGLTEAIKWGKPCYSHNGENVVILQEMNDFLSLMFFKGALLADPNGVLEDQGPNTRSARRMTFTSTADVRKRATTIKAYLEEAIDVSEAGLQVAPPPELDLVEELQERLAEDPALRAGFESLTPGRRREYNLHIAGAKQSKTRHARIDKYAAKIAAGEGMRDR